MADKQFNELMDAVDYIRDHTGEIAITNNNLQTISSQLNRVIDLLIEQRRDMDKIKNYLGDKLDGTHVLLDK